MDTQECGKVPLSNELPRLMEQAAGGQASAWDSLVTRLEPTLRAQAARFLNRRVRQRVTESDVVQETLLEASRSATAFRGDSDGHVFAWFLAILQNNARDLLRRHCRTKKRSVRQEQPIPASSSSGDGWEKALAHRVTPSREAVLMEQMAALFEALGRLPPRQQRAVYLRHIERKPLHEIAAELECSYRAGAALVNRGVQELLKFSSGVGR